jgi:starch phosphorylase
MAIHHDLVCGMPVADGEGVRLEREQLEPLWFCSEFCRQQFLKHPHAYEEASGPAPPRDVQWSSRRVAYFSMEIALSNEIPTFSGGLGVLAGDTLRSCADLQVPVVAVSLVHRRGYFRQEIRDDWQIEHDATWEPQRLLEEMPPRVTVEVENRTVHLRAWLHRIVGVSGYVVPVLLLDTDTPENQPEDRRITDHLYGGDERYRLMQEIVLGVGGTRLLRALRCSGLRTFHLNEGHAALAPLELLRTETPADGWDFGTVRNRTVFTTHTPIAAGHDRFEWGLVSQVLGNVVPRDVLEMLGGRDRLNMTQLALNLSHYVNGVALRHREVSSDLFPRYEIHQITNGVHARTWTSPAFMPLFDRRIPGWRVDPLMLRNAVALPAEELWAAHQGAKQALIDVVAARTGRRLDAGTLTIGFARRATGYKRPGLVFSDLEALRAIARTRRLQFVFAGKAHPKDEPGKQSIQAILRGARELGDDVPVAYLPAYDLELGRAITAGVDVWLNTPLPPLEASGTSGMKAALNGVPSFSVLDGWWREGWVEGVTGWAIGGLDRPAGEDAGTGDAADLYRKLEHVVAPLYYDQRDAWIRIMQQCIALNASFFNTHRMVRQYMLHAYGIVEHEPHAMREVVTD